MFTFLQLAAGLVLGVHIPADIAQLAVFLPNSRCCWDSWHGVIPQQFQLHMLQV